MKRWRTLLAIGILTAGLATGLYFSNQRAGTFELRKKAAEIQGSQLLFKGPQKVNVGEKFTVNLILDTTIDSKYTISGVDAVVYYNGPQNIEGSGKPSSDFPRIAVVKPETNPTGRPEFLPIRAISLLSITPGKIFDSYPTQTPACVPLPPCADGTTNERGGNLICAVSDKPPGGGEWCPRNQLLNPVTISGVKNYSVNDKGYFNGFTGQDIFATLTFVAQNPGKATINLVYNSPTATDDTNINGFLAKQPVSLQKPQERLLISPQAFSIQVVVSQPTMTPAPTTTCTPRPPCADGVKDPVSGRIVICDPAPGTNWCPYRPTPTPTPICQTRPSCLDTPPYCRMPEPVGGWCRPTPTPKPTCTPLPPCAYEGTPDPNDPSRRVFCAVDLLPGAWSCPRPTSTPTPRLTPTLTPTPTPEPRVMINFRLQLEGRKSHATVVDVYGMIEAGNKPPSKEVLQALGTNEGKAFIPGIRIDKLGTAVTDPSGTGVLSLDRSYVGGRYILLFAQTPSHLRKAARNYQAIRLDVGQNPVCRAEICTQEVKYVDFGTLTAGDVYTDASGNKDNLINTFDVGVVFVAWSGADVVAKPRDTSSFGGILPKGIGQVADLNGDGVVNNRDLALLLANFNKRGDTSVPPSDIKITPTPRPLPVITGAP